MRYQHTQTGWSIVVPLAIGMSILTGIAALHQRPWLLGVILILFLPVALFHSLTVMIDDRRLILRFGVGMIGRAFDLDDIISVKPVQNRLSHGFGIRYCSDFWLFNVHGLDAVEITLANGQKFRIGTDEPDRLTQAIGAFSNARLEEKKQEAPTPL